MWMNSNHATRERVLLLDGWSAIRKLFGSWR